MDKYTRAGHQNKHDSMRALADRLTKFNHKDEGKDEVMTTHNARRQKFAAGGVAKIRLGQCSSNGKTQLGVKKKVLMMI